MKRSFKQKHCNKRLDKTVKYSEIEFLIPYTGEEEFVHIYWAVEQKCRIILSRFGYFIIFNQVLFVTTFLYSIWINLIMNSTFPFHTNWRAAQPELNLHTFVTSKNGHLKQWLSVYLFVFVVFFFSFNFLCMCWHSCRCFVRFVFI